MDNLSKKILKRFLLLSLFLFLILGSISYFWIKQLYVEQIRTDLIHDLDIIELELQKDRDFQKIADDIKRLTSIRVTIIDKDGKVLADSDADATKMQNHKSRPEIFEATYKPYGTSIRESYTVSKELLYVAKKIRLDDKEYFLRVATNFHVVYDHFIAFMAKITILFLLFTGGFAYIIYKISDEIRIETDRVVAFLEDLKSQRRSLSISSTYSEEFNRITKLLSETSEALAKKAKKKSKYTAKLKLANRQKDEILSAISHEFKNPISVISGYAQTLLEDMQMAPKLRKKFIDKIYTSAKKLSAMIDRLRLFIKLEEDSHPLKYTKSSINKIVNDVITQIQESYPNREIYFNTKEDLIIEVDEALFSIAVKNLIENALKYSEDEIYIRLSKDKLEVEDRGIGIEKREIDKITSKFYRVSNNGWDNSLGIGLSLVAHIVRVHNFKLEIESQKGEGSLFKIVF
ncbi:Two-component system histidine kinase [hydrothermal vent metagenome]|uniref:histidine kinase n=1 Tax=hydrothermal vent metagenome TaxID=652676 RepID=A0A1W1B8H0_9ZZZZ